MRYMSLSKKKLTIVLAFLVAFVMLYFVGFEATHEIHECTGSDCPICHELQIAEAFVKQLSAGLLYAAIGFFTAFIVQMTMNAAQCSIQERTLITDKVRMDN